MDAGERIEAGKDRNKTLTHQSEDAILAAAKRELNLANLFACGGVGLGAGLVPLITLLLASYNLSAGLLLGFTGMGVSTMTGTLLSRKRLRQCQALLQEVADRGDVRALSLLMKLASLTLLNPNNPQGIPVATALIALMQRVTPADFQAMSGWMVLNLTGMAVHRYQPLREAVRDLLARAGDGRALTALQNPLSRPVEMQMADEDRERLRVCCETLRARIEAEQSIASLLRPSSEQDAFTGEELLRPAAAKLGAASSAQLLRAASSEEVKEPPTASLTDALAPDTEHPSDAYVTIDQKQ